MATTTTTKTTTTPMKTTLKAAAEVADRCNDAYSFDAFGTAEWRKAARMMARRGYADQQIEAVLRSKWTRWSRDAEGSYRGSAKGLEAFLDNTPADRLARDLRQLVVETFGNPEPDAPIQHDAPKPDTTAADITGHKTVGGQFNLRRCYAQERSRDGQSWRRCTKDTNHTGDCTFGSWVVL